MGQKINPNGFRIGVNKSWNSQWFTSDKNIAKNIVEDNRIRTFIKNKYKNCAISKIIIERAENKLNITLHTAKPGMVIGQKGAGVEEMKRQLIKLSGNEKLNINVVEIKYPDFDAQLVADSIATSLEQRVGFRRAMKQALTRCLKAGVKGIKIMVGGRLDGAEIARSEHYQEGSLPLQTIRANIDYGFSEAHVYGKIGVKVWIYKGEILGKTNLTAITGGDKNGINA